MASIDDLIDDLMELLVNKIYASLSEDFAKKQEPGEIDKKTMAQAFIELVPGCYKKNSCGIEYPDICLDHLLSGGGTIRCVSEPDGNLACAKCWQRPYNGEFEVK